MKNIKLHILLLIILSTSCDDSSNVKSKTFKAKSSVTEDSNSEDSNNTVTENEENISDVSTESRFTYRIKVYSGHNFRTRDAKNIATNIDKYLDIYDESNKQIKKYAENIRVESTDKIIVIDSNIEIKAKTININNFTYKDLAIDALELTKKDNSNPDNSETIYLVRNTLNNPLGLNFSLIYYTLFISSNKKIDTSRIDFNINDNNKVILQKKKIEILILALLILTITLVVLKDFLCIAQKKIHTLK